MNTQKELIKIKNIYSTGGNNKREWEKFSKDITNNLFSDKIVLFLDKNMKENPKNELTLDIIDFIIEYGNQKIINSISQKQFMDTFLNLLKEETNAGIEVQKKVVFLIKKWSNKFKGNNDLSIYTDNFNYLSGKGITFPPDDYMLKTYDKFVNIKELEYYIECNKNINEENNKDLNLDKSHQKAKNDINNNNNINNLNNNSSNKPVAQSKNNNINNLNTSFPLPNNNNANNINLNNVNVINPFENIPLNTKGYPTLIQKIPMDSSDNNSNNNFNNNNNSTNPQMNNYSNINIHFSNPFASFNNMVKNNYPNDSSSNSNDETKMIVNTWKNKIKTYNEYIDEGKFSYHANKLKEGIKEILGAMPSIDKTMAECMQKGDENGRKNLMNIKSDMEQTCFRHECLKNDKKFDKFNSAFDGNSKKYAFNGENLFKEKDYIPFNDKGQENKILTGLENLGNNLKDGAFFVGNKIKDAATEGYGFVKDKFNQNK